MILTQATTWMNLENIMLSGRNQTQKGIYTEGFHLHEVPRLGKFRETESRIEVTRGWGLLSNGHSFCLGSRKLVEIVTFAQHYKCT